MPICSRPSTPAYRRTESIDLIVGPVYCSTAYIRPSAHLGSSIPQRRALNQIISSRFKPHKPPRALWDLRFPKHVGGLLGQIGVRRIQECQGRIFRSCWVEACKVRMECGPGLRVVQAATRCPSLGPAQPWPRGCCSVGTIHPRNCKKGYQLNGA